MSAPDRRERFTWQPGMLKRVDGLEPCERVHHEPHADEYGSCPGYRVELTPDEERDVDRRLEAEAFDIGPDDYGDWHSGADR
jgi:hypothetical protein